MIVSHGTARAGQAWFEVHTKSGQTMEFGNSTDSRSLARGKTAVSGWTVNKASDTKSTYCSVSYANDTVNGQFDPELR